MTTAPLEAVLERDWDAQLFGGRDGLAPMLGWRLSYHTLRSKGSQAGFPDRVIVRDRIIYAELKREKKVASPVSATQREWLDGLAKAGAEVYLWRPSDLDEIAEVLSKRWHYRGHALTLTLFEGDPHPWWTPGSMWMPGQGRADQQ